MATKTVTLKDSNGDTLYPVTDSNVVNINQQKTLAQALDGVVYAEDPTAPANPDAWVASSDIDWSSVGDLSGSGFLQVVKKVDTRTLNNGDNDFSVNISSVIPSGFSPIGIVGRSMSGAGYTRIRVTKEYISDDGTKIWVSNYFDYGSSQSITTTFYILCAKTS